jgi:nucleoside-diphosphate-sugar epimerase
VNVLVTGSAGYIGPVVVRALRLAGHKVVGYDLEWFAKDVDSDWFVHGDIRDPLLHPAWPEVVVHLAGLSNDPMGAIDPGLTENINLHGTLRAVHRHPYAHHVVVSSCSVYGVAETPVDEEAPTDPQSLYAAYKRDVDSDVTWNARSLAYGLSHTILRLGTVFGPAPNHRLDLVVNRMVYDGLNTGVITAFGDSARPLVHVEDVASAVVWAIDQRAQGIFNIVGENVRVRSLAQDLAHHMGVATDFKAVEYDTRDYMASGSKALAAGWAPLRSVLGSLPGLVQHTLAIPKGALDEHVRLAQLRRLIDQRLIDPATLRRAA